jgi:hypothetical protein
MGTGGVAASRESESGERRAESGCKCEYECECGGGCTKRFRDQSEKINHVCRRGAYMLWNLSCAVFATTFGNQYQHYQHALHRIVRIVDT